MGEWQKVVVDNQLPLKCPYSPQSGIIKRGTTFKPDEVEEFWALLLEKVLIIFWKILFLVILPGPLISE